MSKIIAISGLMGSGKSSISSELKELETIKVIDADILAKELMNSDNEIISEIDKTFSAVKDGKIDYKKLGQIVFGDDSKLELLNSIVHPKLIRTINSLSSDFSKYGYITVIDAALVPNWHSLIYEKAIWIDAPIAMRIDRIIQRTKLDRDTVTNRINKQNKLILFPHNDNRWIKVDNSRDLSIAVNKVKEIVFS